MDVRRWLVGLAMLAVPSCRAVPARPAIVPAPVRALGGFYQPWTPLHESHWTEVLRCMGLDPAVPHPTVWIVAGGLTQDQQPLAGLYEPASHAIVVALDALPYSWLVFRHEAIHAVARDPAHARLFDRADECHYWPAA